MRWILCRRICYDAPAMDHPKLRHLKAERREGESQEEYSRRLAKLTEKEILEALDFSMEGLGMTILTNFGDSQAPHLKALVEKLEQLQSMIAKTQSN